MEDHGKDPAEGHGTRRGKEMPGPGLKFPVQGITRHLLKREFLRYLGPGFLITVGFIDPGNWATNIEGGARYNYDLLWVITLSTLILILLQRLSARIGIITGNE